MIFKSINDDGTSLCHSASSTCCHAACVHRRSKPGFSSVVTVMYDGVQAECVQREAVCAPEINDPMLSCDVRVRKYT